MMGVCRDRSTRLILIAASLSWGTQVGAAGMVSSTDLSKPFATRSAWRFTAVQAPKLPYADGERIPGAIRLCISNDKGRSCQTDLRRMLWDGEPDNPYLGPHFLRKAEIVRLLSGQALLLVQAANLPSGDGEQGVATQLFAYDRRGDRFIQVYAKRTPRNENQEVRYIRGGPLQGAVISAEPTRDAPFGFWIIVDRPTRPSTYRQVLRYRSATRYGDGNPLAVIDSEMPNIWRRLGLWHPGARLPLPKGRCPRPRMVRMELWCN